MIQEIYNGSDESILEEPFTKGLGELKFYHPVGTFSITPASRTAVTRFNFIFLYSC